MESDPELPADCRAPDWLSGITPTIHTSFIYRPPRRSAAAEPTLWSTAARRSLTEAVGEQGHRDQSGVLPPLRTERGHEDSLTRPRDVDTF